MAFAPLYRLRAWGFRLLFEDRTVRYVALAFVASELVTLLWDLPGSHGWENDGVAPRDLFGGIAKNLTPGEGHRYPLLHYLLLGLGSLPILLAGVLSGPLDAAAVRERVLSVPVMTGVSLVAKLLAITMAALALFLLARIVRRTVNERAAFFTALFVATHLSFAFYGRVSNLDVPYLFWTVLALDRLLDLAEQGDRRSHVGFAVCAAASLATKDQAYASYVLLLPFYLFFWLRSSAGAPRQRRFRLPLAALLSGLLSYGLFSGALVNPTGFAARVRELRGPASQDWRAYSANLEGFLANARDVLGRFPGDSWPWPLVATAGLGVVIAALSRGGGTLVTGRAARLVPFAAGASSLFFFTLAVGRAEHRFLLPFGFFLSAYGGIAVDWLLGATPWRPVRRLWLGLAGLGFAWAALASFAVHLTQLGDARREVSEWLSRLPRGTNVETYGLVVYQPHFDMSETAPYRVTRVGPEPARRRNPLVGARELEGHPAGARERAADVLVFSEGFANAYFAPPPSPGRPGQAVVRKRQADLPTRDFVNRALRNELSGYRLALHARPRLPRWANALGLEPVKIQSTTGLELWLLVRDDRRVVEGGRLGPPHESPLPPDQLTP